MTWKTVLITAALGAALVPSVSSACGCFTPPDPTVPVVQAGERILFAVKDGIVTAHIQVQYSGGDSDFGWLLPLPSVPSVEVGSDELFAQLLLNTQPRYTMTTTLDRECAQPAPPFGYATGGGTGGGSAGGGSGSADAGSGPSVLVVQDSVGPYDYAVLRADSKTEMLDWLAQNHYFVPAGTDAAVTPYIHVGSYFLALKLHPGNSTGDIQPVVLTYQSDFGIIPLTLTGTGAQDNMGVQVWMLGDGRAIPRNYHHTVLNDAVIDWRSSGANYNDVVIRAAGEAPGKHTFVTEFSGPGTSVKNAVAYAGRFGDRAEFEQAPSAAQFVDLLWARGFSGLTVQNPYFPVMSPQVKSILSKYLPPPTGVTMDTFLANYRYYAATAPLPDYRPVDMAAELWTRVVEPMRKAGALFDTHPTLTRLYTTISPADMNRDPAFSFNPSLPAVSNRHAAEMHVHCDKFRAGTETTATLITEQGWVLEFPRGRFGAPEVPPSDLPASLVVEILREEGPAERVIDNLPKLGPVAAKDPSTPAATCSSVGGVSFGVLGLVALLVRRRRVL
ncbi:MAG: DUF2330 domain-containing protein [Myxococcaceae bacterium]